MNPALKWKSCKELRIASGWERRRVTCQQGKVCNSRSGCPDPIGMVLKFCKPALWGNFLVKGTGPLKHTWALKSSLAGKSQAEPCRG